MYYKENRDKKLDMAAEIWDCKGQMDFGSNSRNLLLINVFRENTVLRAQQELEGPQ